MPALNRRYDIDWVRVIAIGLLLVYHGDNLPTLGHYDRVYYQRHIMGVLMDSYDDAECMAYTIAVLHIGNGRILRVTEP